INVGAGTLTAANYDFTNLVGGNLTITPAHLTVAANAMSSVYGAPVPALGATITGFVGGDGASVISGSPALTTTATETSPVGGYPITVGVGTLTAANYDFPTLVGNTLTVSRARLTVTANAATTTYGGAIPPLSATLSGFVGGDTASVVTGAAGLSTPATAASGVGVYPITVGVGTLTAANYDFPTLVGN